jgi:hypothetical protein
MFAAFGDYGYMSIVRKLAEIGSSSCVKFYIRKWNVEPRQ